MNTAADRTAIGDPEAQPTSPRRLPGALRFLPWAALAGILALVVAASLAGR